MIRAIVGIVVALSLPSRGFERRPVDRALDTRRGRRGRHALESSIKRAERERGPRVSNEARLVWLAKHHHYVARGRLLAAAMEPLPIRIEPELRGRMCVSASHSRIPLAPAPPSGADLDQLGLESVSSIREATW